ncbi:rluC [Symbiodinium sp. CCMP2592]|nr:rluC [Symbiodinium sp. CCMP2592]
MKNKHSADGVRLIVEATLEGKGYGKTQYKVYEAIAGLKEDGKREAPYLFVWLHGMDNGMIEPAYLRTMQTRMNRRVIFMVPKSPNTTADGWHFNWGCCFTKSDNKKQLGYVFGSLHLDYLRDLTAKISEIASIFQAERTLVMGYSMGGFGAFQLGAMSPDVFDVVVSVAGYGLGTLEPQGEMYDAPQPRAGERFELFLRQVATRLSVVPVVLAMHARKDSMSSFRDVNAIIHHVQDESIKKGSDSIVQLFEVPDEKADSDRGRKKKNKSGHHYFNYTLLDESSEDFFWSKLQGFLQVAVPRLELQMVSFDSIGRFGLSNTGKPVCARCGPCWKEAKAGEIQNAGKSLRIPQFVFAGRQSSPSDQRVPETHRLLNEVQDSAEATAEGDAWGEEPGEAFELCQDETEELPGEVEDQPWEAEEFQEEERELGEEVLGEDGEPPPEEEELSLEHASFAPQPRRGCKFRC